MGGEIVVRKGFPILNQKGLFFVVHEKGQFRRQNMRSRSIFSDNENQWGRFCELSNEV